MTWTKVRVKYKRWTLEAYSPDWKRGKVPFVVLHRSPRAKRRRGARPRSTNPTFETLWPYIVLKARTTMHVEQGSSEREAIAKGMLEMAWKPTTWEEIERVRARNSDGWARTARQIFAPVILLQMAPDTYIFNVLHVQRGHSCQSQQSTK